MLSFKPIISSNLFFVILFISMLSSTVGMAQNCSANLSVEKDRNVRSADESGTSFSLELKNTSSASLTYLLSTVNLKEPCDTRDNSSNQGNVTLDVNIVGDGINFQNNEITLNPGQTFNFKVQVNVPQRTPFYRWSCIEVQVYSDKCNSISDTQLLKVYVPNPSEG